ncbi:alpha/beta hydrolase [Frondihabitans australicus]|uniref:Alpha/beta hydrolase family protein n=1 Tax=Frondihabitans australicus TaxID=386892 RepID=A0A495IEB7_9MICO|nr:alpha/beta hydrolase [Frondihabitans australicus]RKR73475.1 alpha/beta hydrolase family protein [Frondihabitans australicus]
MRDWSTDDPGLGDTTVIDTFAARLTRDAAAASSISTTVASSLSAVPSFWRGSGATAWSGRLSRQTAALARLHTTLETCSRAARAYSAAVDDIQRRARTQIALLTESRSTLDLLPLEGSGTAAPSTVDLRAQEHAESLATISAATATLASLTLERQHADDAFVAALRTALPDTWPAQLAAFASLGVTHPLTASSHYVDAAVSSFVAGLEHASSYDTGDATTLLVLTTRGDLDPAQVTSLLRAHPALGSALGGVGPAVVAEWWRSLGDGTDHSAAQNALVAAAPTAIGNLNGVAYWARDTANRAELARRLDETSAELAVMIREGSPGQPDLAVTYRSCLTRLQVRKASLQDIKISLATRRHSDPSRQLISLTSDEPPLAAVALGDMDTSPTVTYMVPGMGSSTREMRGWVRASANVYEAQRKAAGGMPPAVVAWVGYKSPPVPSLETPSLAVLGSSKAQAGADALARDLAGLNATRQPGNFRLNVVAHSYGTTTASLALAQRDLAVDNFVSVASAGIDTSVPDATAIHATHVYAEQAQNVLPVIEHGEGDEYAWTGRLGSGRENPMDPMFGATRLAVGDEAAADGIAGVTAHDGLLQSETRPDPSVGYGYFDNQTLSLRNIARATTGHENALVKFTPPRRTLLEQILLKQSAEPEVSP